MSEHTIHMVCVYVKESVYKKRVSCVYSLLTCQCLSVRYMFIMFKAFNVIHYGLEFLPYAWIEGLTEAVLVTVRD